MSKYLDTKKGSLEQSILGVWQTAIEEKDARKTRSEKLVGGQKKLDKDKDGDIDAKDFAMLRKAAKKTKKEEVELTEKVDKKLANATLSMIKNQKFVKGSGDFVPKIYLSKDSLEVLKKRFGRLPREFPSPNIGMPVVSMINFALGSKDGRGPYDTEDGDSKSPKLYNNDSGKVVGKPKTVGDAVKMAGLRLESVDLEEGKMSQLHQLMKDGKTAEEIAKIMRVDAKTIKKLMAGYMKDMKEYYEIGTDEYRKHTEDVTPGENGDWAKHVGEKSQSMREALAKVWGVSEGKSPFKKEEKKSLTKEVKDGKTMTGKKIAKVDINPTIKEKAK